MENVGSVNDECETLSEEADSSIIALHLEPSLLVLDGEALEVVGGLKALEQASLNERHQLSSAFKFGRLLDPAHPAALLHDLAPSELPSLDLALL